MNSTYYDPKKLKEARELRELSVREVADEIGVSPMLISRAEKGKQVSFEKIADLCRYYSIPVNSIIYPHPEKAAA